MEKNKKNTVLQTPAVPFSGIAFRTVFFLLLRYNFLNGVFGGFVLSAGFIYGFVSLWTSALILLGIQQQFGISSFYWNLQTFLSLWQYLDTVDAVLLALFWGGIFVFVLKNRPLFYSVLHETEFPGIQTVSVWQPHLPSPGLFLLTLTCFAPILIYWGGSIFFRCTSFKRSRIELACTLYDYLDDWGDWVPYPQFESQRQAILLLYRLGMVRISYRFGKLQVKKNGATPKRCRLGQELKSDV